MRPGMRQLAFSLRARLTIWYTLVLAAILLAYAGGVYAFLRQNLYRELDRRLHDEFEAAEASLERRADGTVIRVVTRDAHTHEEDAPGGRRLEVWSLEGARLYREGPERPALPPPVGAPSSTEETETVRVEPGTILRVRCGTYPIGGTPVLIRVARSEMGVRHELTEFSVGMALGLPAAVLLACLGGYFLAGRALKPVGQMAARARSITAERLEERLPIENPDDELGQLGTVFNGTLARLERSFESLRRFTSDAAHELRTPLTALRSVGEVALRERRSNPAYREVIASMLEEVDRLSRLVDTLLTLSRSDSGLVDIGAQRLDLSQFARETVDDMAVLADEKRQRMTVESEPDVYVDVDPGLLRQALGNILDNAIRHSPEDVPIHVSVYRILADGSDRAVLEVIDQGPGIEVAHQRRIFERFYRVDRARSREDGGVGLGLSIAQWAVQANGGSIELESQPGEGSTFRIQLPLVRQVAHA